MSVYILSGARTPSGSFNGSLSTVSAPRLGAIAIRGAIDKAGIEEKEIDEVFMGNVVQAGQGQAPGRQAVIYAGLPKSVQCTTLNKVCGSGMKAMVMAAQTISAGDNRLVMAGGMENMSLGPYFIPNGRNGYRFGDGELKDAMAYDGLTDPYDNVPMGVFAEKCAQHFDFKREDQDGFAVESFKRSQNATQKGFFKDEIVPVKVVSRRGETLVENDEGPFKVDFEKIPRLKPAFKESGTVTAANSSTINDGAAAIVLGGRHYRDKARYKIVSHAGHAQDPEWFTTAPIPAIKKCLDKANMNISDIDIFEINEAFAVVTMAAIKELNLDSSKVNVFGGAVSLGHPIGCSGARIMVTLMNAMEKKNARFGLSAICIGGGEATAMIIEKI